MEIVRYYHITLESWAAVFCLVAAIVIYPARTFDRGSSRSCIGLLLTDCLLNIAEVTAWVYRDIENPGANITVRLAYFTVFICVYLLLLFLTWHMAMVLKTRGGTVNLKMSGITCILALTGILTVIASRIFGGIYTVDHQNHLIRCDSYWVTAAIAMLALIPLLIQTIENRGALRKREYAAFLCLSLLPLAGGIVQLMFDGLSTFNAANSLSFIILILVYQYEYTADVIERERLRAAEQISLYTRQIQPHFIYNCLSTIRSYLDEDSKAWESLNHFAGFLRGSIDLLSAESCIPAEREFATVMDYLYMEKERFGDDLRIETDISDIDFLIPAFTIQMLVENAVQHGIRENPGGRGTLILKSFESEDAHIIEVKDDGTGFDLKRLPFTAPKAVNSNLKREEACRRDDGHSHIGLENVRKRLELMCSGSLTLESEPEKGSVAVVKIPKNQ